MYMYMILIFFKDLSSHDPAERTIVADDVSTLYTLIIMSHKNVWEIINMVFE